MKRSPRRTIDCLGLGIVPLDILLTVPAYPPPGGKENASLITVQGGGPVPNCLIGLSRLGVSVGLLAAVGSDLFGKLGLEELRDDRIDISNVLIKSGASDTAAGFIEDGSGRRTIVLHRSAFVRPAEIRTSALPHPRLIHLDGRDLDACIKLARWGRRIGAIVSFDIGSVRNDVSPIFPLVDHLVVADAFALPFTGKRTARSAARELGRICPGTIVITEGIRGALAFEDGRFGRGKAYRIKAVDTTGAGDAFHCGYLYGVLNGFTMAERLKWGAACAALKCTKPGARAGLPRRREIERFLKRKPAEYA